MISKVNAVYPQSCSPAFCPLINTWQWLSTAPKCRSTVLFASKSKWNFLKFTPGLVGGHCIGVDPYYLTYRAEQLGWHSQIIAAGRRINDDMGRYVAENLIKCLIKANKNIRNAKVAILGFTFKENCPDTRNTKIIDIIRELREYDIEPVVADPEADAEEAKNLYGINLENIDTISGVDALVVAVSHERFNVLSKLQIDKMFSAGRKVLMDLKGLYCKQDYVDAGYIYWRL